MNYVAQIFCAGASLHGLSNPRPHRPLSAKKDKFPARNLPLPFAPIPCLHASDSALHRPCGRRKMSGPESAPTLCGSDCHLMRPTPAPITRATARERRPSICACPMRSGSGEFHQRSGRRRRRLDARRGARRPGGSVRAAASPIRCGPRARPGHRWRRRLPDAATFVDESPIPSASKPVTLVVGAQPLEWRCRASCSTRRRPVMSCSPRVERIVPAPCPR